MFSFSSGKFLIVDDAIKVVRRLCQIFLLWFFFLELFCFSYKLVHALPVLLKGKERRFLVCKIDFEQFIPSHSKRVESHLFAYFDNLCIDDAIHYLS